MNPIQGGTYGCYQQGRNERRGSVLSDQIKSLDWTVGNIEYIEAAKKEVIEEVIGRLKVLIT